MLPIAILPVAGLLLGIGSSFTNETTIVSQVFSILFLFSRLCPHHSPPIPLAMRKLSLFREALPETLLRHQTLPLIFAIGVAIGMAKKEKEVSALSAVIAYLVTKK